MARGQRRPSVTEVCMCGQAEAWLVDCGVPSCKWDYMKLSTKAKEGKCSGRVYIHADDGRECEGMAEFYFLHGIDKWMKPKRRISIT